jgi:hypothetical protein
MSVEILLLVVLAGITLLAYMVAINSHGPTRLAFSYLLATVILAGTVWATVQYVNTGVNSKKEAELAALAREKEQAEARLSTSEQAYQSAMKENKERLAVAAKLNGIVTGNMALATTIMNTDLRDMSNDLDGLIAKSLETKRITEQTLADYEKNKITDTLFIESAAVIKDGLKLLAEAGLYYSLYYKAEDSAQEELRERIMRQKAKNALSTLQRASALIASKNNQ